MVPFGVVVRAACLKSRYPQDVVCGPSRYKGPVRMRMALAYVGRHKMKLAYPQIAKVLKRDHSSVIHGDKVFRAKLAEGDDLAIRYYKIAVRAWVQAKRAEEGERLAMCRTMDTLVASVQARHARHSSSPAALAA
jgi:hypothetical protein